MVIIIKRFKNIKDKNKGYISIEIIILMTIMFITGMLIMGKWLKPGQDAVKQEETVFSTVLHNAGTPYQPVDPHPFPGGGGGSVNPAPTPTDANKIFAVYSSDDQSLRIYADDLNKVVVGQKYRGKTVTEIFSNFVGKLSKETIFKSRSTDITSIVIEDNITLPEVTIDYLFSTLSKVNYVNVSKLDTRNVTSMQKLFAGTGQSISEKFEIIGLDTWNVSNVTNMSDMFAFTGFSAKNWSIGNLSNWNVSSVRNMNSMFRHAGMHADVCNIGNLNSWNVGNVTDMSAMFADAGKMSKTWNIGQLNNWNVSNVVMANAMFQSAGQNATNWSIGDLSHWNVSNVKNMNHMFALAGRNATNWNIGDVSQWDVSNVSAMVNMFNSVGVNSQTFTLNLSGWDASNVTDISGMFHNVGANKIMTPKNISPTVTVNSWGYDVISKPWYDITDNNKEYLPGTFPIGNGPVSHTLVRNKPVVDNKTYVLQTGPNVNAKLKEVDAKNKIKSIEFVDTVKPDTGVTEITGLDLDNDGGVVAWYTVDTTDNMAKVYVSTQNVGQKVIANQDSMMLFCDFREVKEINVSKLDTSSVVNMRILFSGVGLSSDISIIHGLETWNTGNVTDMTGLFSYTKFQLNGIEQWDVRKVEKIGFQGPGSTWNGIFLNSGADYIDTSQWELTNCTDLSNMFSGLKIGASVKFPKYIRNDAKITNLFNSTYAKRTKWVDNITGKEYLFDDIYFELDKLLNDKPWGHEFTLHLVTEPYPSR